MSSVEVSATDAFLPSSRAECRIKSQSGVPVRAIEEDETDRVVSGDGDRSVDVLPVVLCLRVPETEAVVRAVHAANSGCQMQTS